MTKDAKFESLFQDLESIVRQLETGELPLEESLTLYEKAMTLIAQCSSKLDAAEMRLEKIGQSDQENG